MTQALCNGALELPMTAEHAKLLQLYENINLAFNL